MRGVVWLPRQGRCRWCGLLNGFVGHLDGRDFSKKRGDFKW